MEHAGQLTEASTPFRCTMLGSTRGFQWWLMNLSHASWKMESPYPYLQSPWVKSYGWFCWRSLVWLEKDCDGMWNCDAFYQTSNFSLMNMTLDELQRKFPDLVTRKAFAKFCHGWGKMDGGDSWYGLQAMVGFKSFVGWTMRDQRWKKKILKEDWAHGKTENARGRKINYKCVLEWGQWWHEAFLLLVKWRFLANAILKPWTNGCQCCRYRTRLNPVTLLMDNATAHTHRIW